MKKLLIYIPIYNRLEPLIMQLNSIKKSNSRTYFDVIVSDDCSTQVMGGGIISK